MDAPLFISYSNMNALRLLPAHVLAPMSANMLTRRSPRPRPQMRKLEELLETLVTLGKVEKEVRGIDFRQYRWTTEGELWFLTHGGKQNASAGLPAFDVRIVDAPGKKPVKAMRELFERVVTGTPRLIPLPLDVINHNGRFSHYRDAQTDLLWVGFALGIRMVTRP